MTGLDPDRFLDPSAFGAVFDAAQRSVFRWEGLQTYAIPDHDPDLSAWRTGAPRQERSVRTSPWLRRIAVQTARGVDWSRARAIVHPLTEYTRYELVAYVESQAVGEQIRLSEQASEVEDFWLVDAGASGAVAVVMHYDDGGHLVGRERVDDPARVRLLVAVQERVWTAGKPLNVWLAEAARA